MDIPRNVGDFRLMDRKVVAEVIRYREHDRFLRGIVAHVGFRQEAVPFDRDPRYAGSSSYPLRTMLKLAADGILGFSTFPLRLISRLGMLISLLSVLGALFVVYVRVFMPDKAVPGWAFITVGMFLLGGIQLLMMGVIGSYLGRVYVETQDRPLYSLALMARGGTRRRPHVSTHIGAAPGDIAPVVLMPGDPLRAKWIAETFLDDARCYTEVRGMLGFTGTWQGRPVSVQGSGMGQPSLAIYVNELFTRVRRAVDHPGRLVRRADRAGCRCATS